MTDLAADLAKGGVRLECEGPVATVVLDRPEKRNAQTPHTWRALARVGAELSGEIRVVVLRGEGSSFSAGLDRAMLVPGGVPDVVSVLDLAQMADAEADALIASYQEAFTWWRRPDVVSICAVQGHAVGAGFQLALATDLRVCATTAQFRMAEPSLGLVPDLGGTALLADLVGYPRALEICATTRVVGAEEALRLRLCELVVPEDELGAAVADLVAALLAAPRDAVVETKALLLGARDRPVVAQRAAEREAQLRRLRDLVGAGE